MADDTSTPSVSGILDPAIAAGFFSSNMTLEEIKRRRAIAAALASRSRGYPKTIGEGMTYFGEAVADAMQERRLAEAEKAYNDRYNKAAGTAAAGGDTLPPLAPRPVSDVAPDIVPGPKLAAVPEVEPPLPPGPVPTPSPPAVTAVAPPPVYKGPMALAGGPRPSPAPPAPTGPMPGANPDTWEPTTGPASREAIAQALERRRIAALNTDTGTTSGAPAPGPVQPAPATTPPAPAPNNGGVDGVSVYDGPNPPTITRDIKPMMVAEMRPPAGPPAAPVQPTATPGGPLEPVIPESLPRPEPPARSERLTPNEIRWGNVLRQFPGDPRAEREFALAKELGSKARDAEYDREKEIFQTKMRAYETRETARQTAITNRDKDRQALIQGAAATTKAQAEEQARLQWGNLPAPVQKDLFEGRDKAKAGVEAIGAINNAERTLNAGTLVGPGAQASLLWHKARALAGNEESRRLVANTQTFQATLGPAVMAAVKAYGGPQVSNTDREYAAAMTGSDVTLDEQAIRRIIDIGKRSAAAALAEHRDRVEEHAKNAPALRKFLQVNDPLAAAPSISGGDKPGVVDAEGRVTVSSEAEAMKLPSGTKVILDGKKFRVP